MSRFLFGAGHWWRVDVAHYLCHSRPCMSESGKEEMVPGSAKLCGKCALVKFWQCLQRRIL